MEEEVERTELLVPMDIADCRGLGTTKKLREENPHTLVYLVVVRLAGMQPLSPGTFSP